MNERDYGVGIANRYALFMGEEGSDPLSDVVRGPKGKENKQQDKATAGKKAAAAPVASGKSATSKNTTAAPAAPATAARTNHAANNHNNNNNNNNISASVKQQPAAAQTTKSAPRDGKPLPAVAQQPAAAKQQQRASQQQPAAAVATDQSAVRREPGVRAEERQRSDRAPADGKSRPPRPPRAAPRDGQAVDWSQSGQSQKEVEERKNRRNREDQNRGPLQSSNFAAPDNAGGNGPDDRSPRNSGPRDRLFRRERPPRVGGAGGARPRNDNRDGRGKPVFDRHSGSEKSGVKAVEKRDGAGAHNWGTVNDDIAAQGDADETQKAETDAPAPSENQENQTTAETEGGVKEPAEDAVKELTLAEYKRQTAAEKRSQPKYNLRKANEGVDGAQFKKTYLLQKKKEDDESEYEEIEVITEAKESKKKVIDIEINFNETFRGGDDRRGGRGGRGRGGGGGGRDGFRDRDRDRDAGPRPVAGDDRRKRPPVTPGGGSRKQAAPKVDDGNEFPSLGLAA